MHRKQLPWAAPLVAAALILTGCGSSDSGGGASSGGGAPSDYVDGGTPEPGEATEVDTGCSEAYPDRLSVPPEVSLAMIACDAEDRRSATIQNLSKGVIRIVVDPGSPAVTFTGAGSDSLAHQLTGQVAPLGDDGSGGYRLGPKASVTAAADVEGGPQIRVAFDATLSVAGFAASSVADYFESLTQRPGQQLFEAGIACVRGVSNTLANLTGRPEDLTNALLDSRSCGTLYRTIQQIGNAPSEQAAAKTLVQSAKRSGPAWDEMFRFAGKAITLVR